MSKYKNSMFKDLSMKEQSHSPSALSSHKSKRISFIGKLKKMIIN